MVVEAASSCRGQQATCDTQPESSCNMLLQVCTQGCILLGQVLVTC